MQNNTISGLFVGQNLVILTEVDSTNNFLKQALANSTPLIEGTVIMAESQFAGRGQQSNSWYSQPGKNLTFSILLNPSFLPPSQQFFLTMAVSAGIVKALQNLTGHYFQIKWPNDIYMANRKLGGILIENMVQGQVVKNSVVGIGLNINQTDFPAQAAAAVSLKQMLHKDYDLKDTLAEICKCIEALYLQLRAGHTADTKQYYLQHLLWLNEPGTFKAGGHTFKGMITGVTGNGQLDVRIDGESRLYNFKEIEFLINQNQIQ